MSPNVPTRLRGSSRKLVAYVLALVLPLLASWATAHSESLRSVPFALQFIALAAIAALGGLWPSLLGVIVALISRGYFVATAPHMAIPMPQFDLTRFAVLLVAVLVISMVGRARHRSEASLEAALATLHERTDALMDALSGSKCASWTLDLDSGKSARWFSGSSLVFGRPFAELEAMPSLRPLLHPDDQPRLLALVEQMRQSTEPVVFEHRVPWPNGELHWLEMRGTRIPGPGCRWRGVTVDITERKAAEAALLRAEKLAAMGRLASTVAHEINNPLEAITNLIYLALRDDQLSVGTRALLASADAEVARLGNITRLTLGFVRNSGVRSVVPIADIVDDVLSIFQYRLTLKRIQVERRFEPGVAVDIVPHELRQIVTNLIANAADAVHAAVDGPAPCIHICITRESGTAVLTVADNGTGISEGDMQRIFDPFFSTKQETGTGIGLWVTRELAEKNGGRIFVNPGKLPPGIHTCFRIEFPLAQD